MSKAPRLVSTITLGFALALPLTTLVTGCATTPTSPSGTSAETDRVPAAGPTTPVLENLVKQLLSSAKQSPNSSIVLRQTLENRLIQIAEHVPNAPKNSAARLYQAPLEVQLHVLRTIALNPKLLETSQLTQSRIAQLARQSVEVAEAALAAEKANAAAASKGVQGMARSQNSALGAFDTNVADRVRSAVRDGYTELGQTAQNLGTVVRVHPTLRDPASTILSTAADVEARTSVKLVGKGCFQDVAKDARTPDAVRVFSAVIEKTGADTLAIHERAGRVTTQEVREAAVNHIATTRAVDTEEAARALQRLACSCEFIHPGIGSCPARR